ncbi:MAG: hypothetical protein AABY86_10360, partial [Bdellovibrionota bacterium]
MKMFRDGMTPFVAAKLAIARIAGTGLVIIGVFLALHILNTEKEMSTLRREQIQIEKLQNKLAAFNKPQTLITLSLHDMKKLDQVMKDRTTKAFGNIKGLQSSLNTYTEYLDSRGDMNAFLTLLNDVNADVSGINERIRTIFPTLKGPEVVITFSHIRRSFDNIQKSLNKAKSMTIGHGQYIFIGEILAEVKENYKAFGRDNGRILEKAIPDYKAQLVTPTEFLIEKLNTIQNKNSFVASQIPVILSLSNQIATIQERLTDLVGIESAYARLGYEHITQVTMMMVLVLFGLTFLALGRIFSRKKVQNSLNVPVPTHAITPSAQPLTGRVQESTLTNFLAKNMATATAVTDADENITWASNSFYQTLGLDPSKCYNW